MKGLCGEKLMAPLFLFIVSTFVLLPSVHAAAETAPFEEPLITAIAWYMDSSCVAIGRSNGTLRIFDLCAPRGKRWIKIKNIEWLNCYKGCEKPLGIMTLRWEDDLTLVVNDHINYRFLTQEIKRAHGKLSLCFRCEPKADHQCIYKKDIATFCSTSPDGRRTITIRAFEPNIFKLVKKRAEAPPPDDYR